VQWLRGGASPEMEKGMMDLKITNPGKDYFIEQPKEEQSVWRESASNHGEVGKLETKVL
jgi:hypothetical protein